MIYINIYPDDDVDAKKVKKFFDKYIANAKTNIKEKIKGAEHAERLADVLDKCASNQLVDLVYIVHQHDYCNCFYNCSHINFRVKNHLKQTIPFDGTDALIPPPHLRTVGDNLEGYGLIMSDTADYMKDMGFCSEGVT